MGVMEGRALPGEDKLLWGQTPGGLGMVGGSRGGLGLAWQHRVTSRGPPLCGTRHSPEPLRAGSLPQWLSRHRGSLLRKPLCTDRPSQSRTVLLRDRETVAPGAAKAAPDPTGGEWEGVPRASHGCLPPGTLSLYLSAHHHLFSTRPNRPSSEPDSSSLPPGQLSWKQDDRAAGRTPRAGCRWWHPTASGDWRLRDRPCPAEPGRLP